jgi:hypothetical protein
MKIQIERRTLRDLPGRISYNVITELHSEARAVIDAITDYQIGNLVTKWFALQKLKFYNAELASLVKEHPEYGYSVQVKVLDSK